MSNKESKESKLILECKPLPTYAYTEALPLQDDRIEYLTAEQLEERTGGRVVIDDNLYSDIPLSELTTACPAQMLSEHFFEEDSAYKGQNKHSVELEKLQKAFTARLENPSNGAVIVNMGKALNNPRLCFGLFAKEDLPKKIILNHFAGTYRQKQETKNEDGLDWYRSRNGVGVYPHKEKGKGRGLGSLLQHQPVPLYIDLFFLDEEQLKLEYDHAQVNFHTTVAEENVAPAFIHYQKPGESSAIPVILMVTTNIIKKGSPLGFSYLPYLLGNGIYPIFFDPQGLPISEKDYTRTYGRFKFPNGVFQGYFRLLIEELARIDDFNISVTDERLKISTMSLEKFRTTEKFLVSVEDLRNRLKEANAIHPTPKPEEKSTSSQSNQSSSTSSKISSLSTDEGLADKKRAESPANNYQHKTPKTANPKNSATILANLLSCDPDEIKRMGEKTGIAAITTEQSSVRKSPILKGLTTSSVRLLPPRTTAPLDIQGNADQTLADNPVVTPGETPKNSATVERIGAG